ncbi:GAK system CofD-like protein [Desulfocurvus sp. DL9XJH121]
MHAPKHSPTNPQDGPRILFFSGGTALSALSRRIIGHTHNTAHVITPFDSGGSSAILRRAFSMAAPGDLRNRLMALADRSQTGNPEVFALFEHRLPKRADPRGLDAELAEMASGAHPLVKAVPNPARKVIRAHLEAFLQQMPPSFDLRGASIGNLILTAAYLLSGRSYSRALDSFSSLARVLGHVAPVCEDDLHLAAELADGGVVCAQHRLTAKEGPAPSSPIQRIWTCRGLDDPTPAPCAASARTLELVAGAELICFPMGSFFTSIMANLLPSGVGRAVAANPCPKVFIPNLGHDPECPHLGVAGRLEMILGALGADLEDGAPAPVVDMVLADAEGGSYGGGLDAEELRALGTRLVSRPLVSARSAPLLDAGLLTGELLALCTG